MPTHIVDLVSSGPRRWGLVWAMALLLTAQWDTTATAQQETTAGDQPATPAQASPSESTEGDKTESTESTPQEQNAEGTEQRTEEDEDAGSEESESEAGEESTADESAEPPQQPAADESRLDKIEAKLDRLAGEVVKLTESLQSQSASGGEAASPGRGRPQRPGGRGRPSGRGGPGQAAPAGGDADNESEADAELKILPEWLKEVPWRSIGPANMSGRITGLDVSPQDSSLWFVATASGGLLKTENQGTSIEHLFDSQETVSIGAVCADPQDKETIWVGTGEINPRNSVSYGNGVYKSVDGGKTWQHMGLEDTYQISRILIHPEDSNVVYVGAHGRLYGTNEERGVYKTTDGGKTWDKVLYTDERTGVIDMIMSPEDPDILIAAMWDRLRDGFDSWPGSVEKPDGIDGYDPIRKWGPSAGLYRTTDGGATWNKLSEGLPTGMTGRIGLDWQSKSPNVIYAIIDCEDIGKGPLPFDVYLGLVGTEVEGQAIVTQVMTDSPAAESQIAVGDVLLEVNGQPVEAWESLLAVLREKEIGTRVELKLQRGEEIIDVSPKLLGRPGSRGLSSNAYMGIAGVDAEGMVKLTEIVEDGPADKAGLEKDDIVLEANGKAVENYESLVEDIRAMAIDETITVAIQRGSQRIEVEVALARRPGGPQQQSPTYMGIRGEDAAGKGARLSSVTEDGPAEKSGLKNNDVIVKVADKDIEDYNDLIEEIRSRQPDDEMPVQVVRAGKTLSLTVVLGDRNVAAAGDRPYTFSYFGQRPNVQDMQGAEGYKYGGVYKSTDAGVSWERVNSINIRPMYFSVIRVDPSDENRVYVLGVSQYQSKDGGVTFTADFGGGVHSDSHDLWINPEDGRHMIIGSDGGYYVTHDRGQNWDHINTAAIGQFYHVTIAPTKPYRVYGGLQDNGSWGGPAISRSGGALNEDWINVGGGDGFVCRVDPNDPDWVYSESQNGSIRKRNLRTGEGGSIRPQAEEGQEFRFNWNTPFLLSHHNSKIIYSAGNYVFRSVNQGDDLSVISPELTRTPRGSATALAESTLDSDVLYVGTDDGALWGTQDGGKQWKQLTGNLGIDPMWIATIEASRFERGRVYVCVDGHRSDDDMPYAFVSEDFGATFTPLAGELPRGSSRCLREDIVNPDLLYLGTEFALWVSADRGKNWTQFNQSLPTVAIHEIAMSPGLEEIVAATHGRSLWACDVSALRGLSSETMNELTLLPPAKVTRWRREPQRGRTNRRYQGENPSAGAKIWYTLPQNASKVEISVKSIAGDELAKIEGDAQAGLHSVTWNMTQGGGRGRRPRLVAPGSYQVVLKVDDQEPKIQVLEVENDPTLSEDAISVQAFEDVLSEFEQLEEESEDGPSTDSDFQ